MKIRINFPLFLPLLALVILIVVPSVLVGCGTKAVTLAYLPRVGESAKYHLAIEADAKITVQKPDQAAPVEEDTSSLVVDIEAEHKINLKDQDGNIEMELSVTQAGARATSQGQEQDLADAGQMQGHSITYRISPNGRLLEIKGIDSMPMAQAFGLQETLAQLHPRFAAGKVAVGDNWDGVQEVAVPLAPDKSAPILKETFKSRYLLEALENYQGHQCARIRYEGELTQTLQAPAQFPFTQEGQGTYGGVVYYDYRLGRLALVQGQLHLQSKMTGTTGALTGATVTSQIKSEIKLDLQK